MRPNSAPGGNARDDSQNGTDDEYQSGICEAQQINAIPTEGTLPQDYSGVKMKMPEGSAGYRPLQQMHSPLRHDLNLTKEYRLTLTIALNHVR
jgi:hypothetical protein